MKPLVRIISILFAVVLFGAIALAASEPSAPGSFPYPRHGLLGRNALVADLDGDGRPDLAVAKTTLHGRHAPEYRLKLYLTAGGGKSSLRIPVREGLFFLGRDVDGDGHLDLVVMRGSSPPSTVAIWLNDGHGRFSESATAYFSPDGYYRVASTFRPDHIQPSLGDYRFDTHFRVVSHIKPAAVCERSGLFRVDVDDKVTIHSAHTRAPPFSVLLHS